MNPLAILAFARANWKALVGVLLGIILCWPVASCSGRADGRAQMRAALVQANMKAIAAQRQADTLASQQRITDTIAVSTREREMIDAVRQGPDSAPDDAARRLGCERLLNANGGNQAALPSACRASGRSQAPANR